MKPTPQDIEDMLLMEMPDLKGRETDARAGGAGRIGAEKNAGRHRGGKEGGEASSKGGKREKERRKSEAEDIYDLMKAAMEGRSKDQWNDPTDDPFPILQRRGPAPHFCPPRPAYRRPIGCFYIAARNRVPECNALTLILMVYDGTF